MIVAKHRAPMVKRKWYSVRTSWLNSCSNYWLKGYPMVSWNWTFKYSSILQSPGEMGVQRINACPRYNGIVTGRTAGLRTGDSWPCHWHSRGSIFWSSPKYVAYRSILMYKISPLNLWNLRKVEKIYKFHCLNIKIKHHTF